MNLPHLEPLLFARKVIRKDSEAAVVLCEFKTAPTLPMLMEAAAQSSAAFAGDETMTAGFLASVREIKSFAFSREKTCHMKITKEAEVGAMAKFFFEAFDLSERKLFASGFITMVMVREIDGR